MKIALTNLGKYNEGELVYTWLGLPFLPEEKEQALKEIGINEQYEEYFVSDYELPFSINEYVDIELLNELVEFELSDYEGIDAFISGKYNEYDILNLSNYLDMNEITDHIVSTDKIDEIIEGKSWASIKTILSGISYTNQEYYYYDNLGHVSDITSDKLKILKTDMFDRLKEKYNIR